MGTLMVTISILYRSLRKVRINNHFSYRAGEVVYQDQCDVARLFIGCSRIFSNKTSGALDDGELHCT